MTALIEATDLFAGYKGVPAVRGLNLTVREGEVVALLGSNGSGKTTTLMTIAGVLPIISGELKVLGETVKGKRIHHIARRGLALVPADRGLFFQLTVAENLRLGYRKGSKISIDDALAYFPALAQLLERRCGLLSGGEQQMLGVARALISGPRVLMIDEMSLGLAPIIVERLLPVIRQIANDHAMGVLLVEQHIHMALALAERAYVLDHGVLAIEGDVGDVRANADMLEASYLGRTAPVAVPRRTIIEQLRSIPLFSSCTSDELDLVAQSMTQLPFTAGEALITEGHRADSFFVIVEGAAVVHRGGVDVAALGPGDFLGESGLLLHQHRNATVTATTDTWVLVADAGRFAQLLDEIPGLSTAVLAAVAERVPGAS